MRRRPVVLALLISLPLTVFLAAVAHAFMSRAPLPASVNLAEGVRLLKDGMVAVFVLDAGGGNVALVDCGNDPQARVIMEELARRGAGPSAVKAILLTHSHGDHVAGCHHFPDARVFILGTELPVLRAESPAHGPWTSWLPHHPVDLGVPQPLQDGQSVTVGTLTARVLAVPGHTPGSAAWLAKGVLFLGDSADSARDGALLPASWVFAVDTALNRQSLTALAQRLVADEEEVAVLAPSHSGPVPGLGPLRALAAAR